MKSLKISAQREGKHLKKKVIGLVEWLECFVVIHLKILFIENKKLGMATSFLFRRCASITYSATIFGVSTPNKEGKRILGLFNIPVAPNG